MHARLSLSDVAAQSAFSFGRPRLMPISENFRHIQQRVIDELLDTEPEYEQMPVNFHLTSVYDHSIREAFSRVLHKLIDSLPYLEDLLNVFCSVSALAPSFYRPGLVPDARLRRTRRRPRPSCLTSNRGSMSQLTSRLWTLACTIYVATMCAR
jgi:Gtr1/RagA G protein conserved region